MGPDPAVNGMFHPEHIDTHTHQLTEPVCTGLWDEAVGISGHTIKQNRTYVEISHVEMSPIHLHRQLESKLGFSHVLKK